MVGKKVQVPNRGDIVWLSFNPTRGREQKGHRPAVVLSLGKYNHRTGLALVCPITSKIKNYPTEVLIQTGAFSGVVLSDQIRCIDWRRRITKIEGSIDIEMIVSIMKNIITITIDDLL